MDTNLIDLPVSDHHPLQLLVDRVLAGGDAVVAAGPDGGAGFLDRVASELSDRRCRAIRVGVSPTMGLSLSGLMAQLTGEPDFAAHDDQVLERGFRALTAIDPDCDRIVLLVSHAEALAPSAQRYIEFACRRSADLIVVFASRHGRDARFGAEGSLLHDRLAAHPVLSAAVVGSVGTNASPGFAVDDLDRPSEPAPRSWSVAQPQNVPLRRHVEAPGLQEPPHPATSPLAVSSETANPTPETAARGDRGGLHQQTGPIGPAPGLDPPTAGLSHAIAPPKQHDRLTKTASRPLVPNPPLPGNPTVVHPAPPRAPAARSAGAPSKPIMHDERRPSLSVNAEPAGRRAGSRVPGIGIAGAGLVMAACLAIGVWIGRQDWAGEAGVAVAPNPQTGSLDLGNVVEPIPPAPSVAAPPTSVAATSPTNQEPEQDASGAADPATPTGTTPFSEPAPDVVASPAPPAAPAAPAVDSTPVPAVAASPAADPNAGSAYAAPIPLPPIPGTTADRLPNARPDRTSRPVSQPRVAEPRPRAPAPTTAGARNFLPRQPDAPARRFDEREYWPEEQPSYTPNRSFRDLPAQPQPPRRTPSTGDAGSDRQSIGTIVVGPDGTRTFRMRP